MKFSVVYKRSAAAELLNLSSDVAHKVKSAIDKLPEHPQPRGYKKLKELTDTYRICLGHYRVIYIISNAFLIISIIKIAHRKSV